MEAPQAPARKKDRRIENEGMDEANGPGSTGTTANQVGADIPDLPGKKPLGRQDWLPDQDHPLSRSGLPGRPREIVGGATGLAMSAGLSPTRRRPGWRSLSRTIRRNSSSRVVVG